jgi:hypothetical protein
MPLALEGKANDATIVDEDVEEIVLPSDVAKLDVDNEARSFLRKFVTAMNCTNDTGEEMSRDMFNALRAEYVKLGAAERYAIMSSLSGTYAQFADFERNDFDTFSDNCAH